MSPQKPKLKIARTRALKRFQDKLGYAVLHLNSIVVGLNAVGTGQAKKSNDLSISWGPGDLKREERLARGFAIRSLMVTAYDALDHYLYDVADCPSPIEDEDVRSILRRGIEHAPSAENLQKGSVDKLSAGLLENKDNQHELRKLLKDFLERYCGKAKRPSIRRRLFRIHEYCQSLPSHSKCPEMPRESYYSAVELLLAWRNVLVHDPDADQLGSNAIDALHADATFFKESHANVDIIMTTDHYVARENPSLKDISTLISILIKYVSSIDSVLIAQCDPKKYFVQSVSTEAMAKGIAFPFPSGLNIEKKVRLALNLASPHGFGWDEAPVKKGRYDGLQFDIDAADL